MDRNGAQLLELAAFFRSKDISLKQDWLRATVEHISAGDQSNASTLQDRLIRHYLQSDLRVSGENSQALPVEENAVLTGSTVVQIVGCQEIGFSLSHQLERLEDYKERQKPVNRRLIRLPEDEVNEHADGGEMDVTASGAVVTGASTERMIGKKMCKVMLEDASGTRLFGIESRDVPQLYVGMSLGSKMILRSGTRIVHGVVLLIPGRLDWLGGSFGRREDREGPEELRTRLMAELAQIPVMSDAKRDRVAMENVDGEDFAIGDDTAVDGYERANGQSRGTSYRGRSRARARGGAGRGSRSRGRATARGRGRGAA